MYKKITHNIVEEHFDHPIASQIKKSMDNRSKLVTSEIFLEDKFRADAKAYFAKYQQHLNEIINAVTGTDEELLIAFDNFFKTPWVDDLGNMTKPIYATEFGERLNQAMRSIATSLFLSMQALKMGKDAGLGPGRLQFAAGDLVQNLNNFNNQWQYQTLNTLFTNLFTDIINRAKAKLAKNAVAESQLAQKNTESWNQFESILIDGIVNQYPERFGLPAKMSTVDNDIM